ncbi:MAG: hypothetical protein ACTSRG_04610 [Candidatus Helarchaeota archaeon]
MEEEEVEMYLDALKEGTPFDRFVSHGHIKDPLETDIASPRIHVERIVNRAIRATLMDGRARFVPIIGIAGSGKTHFYWVLKDREMKTEEGKFWSCVYIPSPPTQVRILNHIYTCVVDELGAEIIDKVSNHLVQIYQTKKLGVFGSSMKDTIEHAIRDNPGVGADVVRALIIYQMGSKENKEICLKWLLGEPLSENELAKIEINSMIEDDDVCLTTLKLFSAHLGRVLILYFDELEIPMRTMGEAAEIKLLETIKRIYNEVPNCIIITACLDSVWDRIYNDKEERPSLADPALKGRMENISTLKPFTLDDIKRYYINSMNYYWENEKNLPPPLENPLFPLDELVFEKVYKNSKGNPRDAIKVIRDYLDRILYPDGYADISRKDIIETPGIQLYERLRASPFTSTEEESLDFTTPEPATAPIQPKEDSDELVAKISTKSAEKPTVTIITPRKKVTDVKTTAPIQESSPKSEVIATVDQENAATTMPTTSEQLEKTLVQIKIEDDNYVIEVNPQSVLGAAIDSVKTGAKILNKKVETKFDFTFSFGNKEKKCGALIIADGVKIGVDVPSVKSFSRSGGVAAYYSVNRLKDGIAAGAFSKAILIVPKNTKGAKYSSVVKSLGDKLKVTEINQKEAEALIYFAKKELSVHGKQIVKYLFPS